MALRIIISRNLGGGHSLHYCRGKKTVPRASFSACHHMKSADDDLGKKSVKIEQMINNLSLNFQKRQMFKFKEEIAPKESTNEKPLILINKPRRTYLPAVLEDKDADQQIKELMNGDQLDSALNLMKKLAIENRFPTSKCLHILAVKCAKNGNLGGIRQVREVCFIGFPQELSLQFNYLQYEAEALWRSGSIVESLDLFYRLYVKYPQIKRKVVNMSKFCFCWVISEHLTEHYANVLNFVDLIANLNDLSPAANLWRNTFASDLFEDQKIAEKLIDSYPKLPEILKLRIPTILKESRENFNSDLFQRLMTLAIRFQWNDHFEIIFGEYLDYLCLMNDVNGVKETLKYIGTFSMTISASKMEKCMAFISQSKKASFPLNRFFKGDNK